MLKRFSVYVIFLVGVIAMAVYTGENTLYIIASVMVLLPVFSVGMLWLSYFRFKYDECVTKTEAGRGESIEYKLKLFNRDLFIYPGINIYFKNSNKIVRWNNLDIHISPLRKRKIERVFECRHIGKYFIGIENIELWDFFRFLRLKPRGKKECLSVKVYPKIIDLTFFKAFGGEEYDGIKGSRYSQIEDYSEIAEIKKYVPGLPLKNIHWKLSAKRIHLMAKKYDMVEGKMTCLFVDIRKSIDVETENHCGAKDIIIEAVIAISKYSLKKNMPVMICLNDLALTKLKISNLFDFDKAYARLSEIQFGSGMDMEDMIKIYQKKFSYVNSFIIITSRVNVSLLEVLVKATSKQMKTALVYSATDKNMKVDNTLNIINGLKGNGVYGYYIEHADKIKEVLEK